ncbi:hypothetical protein CR51_35940 [Caballeronia megalochromosomata]|nr:hypothetical protein CR51_35940 [Caballeronia megalochromosomata]
MSTQTNEQEAPPKGFEEGSLEYRLSKFNAKERFALIQRILGVHFVPHADFQKEVIGEGFVPRPEEVFCAMDFHLDWLKELVEGKALKFESGTITGKQQDVDFVLCFTNKLHNETHLLLIEAKGVGNWDTAQMESKFAQYRAMKAAFDLNKDVKPRLILMSPTDPFENETRQNEKFRAAVKGFTDFGAKPVWVKMPMQKTFAVVRCLDDLTPTQTNPTCYKLKQRPWISDPSTDDSGIDV